MFVVRVDEDVIHGNGWTIGSTLHITIVKHGSVPSSPYERSVPMGVAPSFEVDVGSQFDIQPGDRVTVTDGVHTKQHTVTHLSMTGSDEVADTISGIATPGATVATWSYSLPKLTFASADPAGHWTAEYAGVHDLIPGLTMGVRESDDDGDGTQIKVTLPVAAGSDVDGDGVPDAVDDCPWSVNPTQYDGDGDGTGAVCDDVDRLWGADRYGTASAVAQTAFQTADVVLIALGTNFPDALVAAAAGGSIGGPVLLTGATALPADTVAELKRLTPSTAYIVGGTAVIGPAVEQQVRTLVPTVKRLAGPDRYGTAAAVSSTIFPTANTAYVALGEDFPDALVAAAVAGRLGVPVLLTRRDGAPQATIDEVVRLAPDDIYIVGGTAAVSETVATQLAPYGTVHRLAGPDRYATAAVVAEHGFMMSDHVFLAYGGNFPDALVAAAAGGHLTGPVLLVTHDVIPVPTREQLDRLTPEHSWVIGGRAVIGDGVFDALP